MSKIEIKSTKMLIVALIGDIVSLYHFVYFSKVLMILFIYYDIKIHKIKKAIAILKKIFDFRAWKIDLYEKLHSDLKTRFLEINYEKPENILPAGF